MADSPFRPLHLPIERKISFAAGSDISEEDKVARAASTSDISIRSEQSIKVTDRDLFGSSPDCNTKSKTMGSENLGLSTDHDIDTGTTDRVKYRSEDRTNGLIRKVSCESTPYNEVDRTDLSRKWDSVVNISPLGPQKYDRHGEEFHEFENAQMTDSDSDSDSSSSGRVVPNSDYFNDEDFDDLVSELGLGVWREWLNIGTVDNQRNRPHGPPEEPLYPQGVLTKTECYVCFEETKLRRRLCCDFPVCDPCLESYLTVQVSQANVNIECLNINCNSYIHRSEISARLPAKMKVKFYKFLIDANVDPTVKTCPRCSSGLQVDKVTLKKRKVLKNGLPVTCQRCGLEWCFTCHAPWHKGLSCKDYRKGDVLLKDWAREFHYGQLNAQKCPKCKIFIQRSLGCDHMICSRCDTSFCYRCGENYRSFKLLGNHFSRLSPFGCRYNFMPDAPHMRRLIRGAVLGGKLIGGLALSGFVVAAGAFLLGISVIALPAWGGYKLHKRRKYRQRLRANQKYARQKLEIRNFQIRKATEPPIPVLPAPTLDSSDSTADYEDSSDENRERVIVGLQVPDSQRVEVLVHRTVGSNSDQEEGSAQKELVTDTSVIWTDVQEVANGDGYTTVVASIYARSHDRETVSAVLDSDGSSVLAEEKDTDSDMTQVDDCDCNKIIGSYLSENSSTRRKILSRNLEQKNSARAEDRQVQCSEAESVDQQFSAQENKEKKMAGQQEKAVKEKDSGSQQEKKMKEKEPHVWKEKKEKHCENLEKNEKKSKEFATGSEMKEKLQENPETHEKNKESTDEDQLSKESSNGCFGNIFSKKITVIQISGRRNTLTQSEAQKTGIVYSKPALWEKNSEKSCVLKPKISMDIRGLPGFNDKTPCQATDATVGIGFEKGVLLQDFFVLTPPGDFRSQECEGEDSLSVASVLSSQEDEKQTGEEEPGEKESGCCLSASNSFGGSNLSCDIITYL